jgi:hypothetical protein
MTRFKLSRLGRDAGRCKKEPIEEKNCTVAVREQTFQKISNIKMVKVSFEWEGEGQNATVSCICTL